jgi:hypothetical protein
MGLDGFIQACSNVRNANPLKFFPYEEVCPQNNKTMKFRTSGDAGDIIHHLPLIEETRGGPHQLFFVDRACTKPLTSRANLLKGLIERQPYIKEVVCTEETPDYDLAEFRGFHRADISLLEAQRQYMNSRYKTNLQTKGQKPWLTNIDPKSEADVIIARSPRYHNHLFPWLKVMNHLRSTKAKVLFIGPSEEHRAFTAQFGPVEHKATKDLLEAAELISGASLFIGNQSSPLAVAEGLKAPRIAEVCLGVCDTIFYDEKAQWCAHGTVEIPALSGSPSFRIESTIKGLKEPREVNRGCPPPCGWEWGDMKRRMSLKPFADQMASMDRSKTRKEWEDAILINTMTAYPEYFEEKGKKAMFSNYISAMRKAGYEEFDLELQAC